MLKQLMYIFNKKEKVTILTMFAMVVVGSFLECAGVGIFMPFVNILTDVSVIQTNEYMSMIYELFGFQSVESFLVLIAVGIIVIFFVKNIYLILEKYAIYKFSYNTQRKISTRLLKAYMSEPYTFFLRNNISVLQRSMQEDTVLFANAVIHFMELIIEVTVCLALGIYLVYISKSIAIVIVTLLLVCVGLFISMSRKFSKSLGRECQEYKARLYQWMNQAIGGIKEIKVLNREPYFVDSYEGYYKKYARGLTLNRILANSPRFVVETVSIAGLIIAVIIKVYYGRRDFMDFIPQLAAFAVAAFRLLPSVGRINEHVTDILYASPSIELIYHDLKDVENVVEISDKLENRKIEEKEIKLDQELTVKDICYHYPDVEENVINHATFTIRKGQTVALIGESGAGKTTVIDIILGLLSPQFGKIRIDGNDIFKNIDNFHKNIGYIPQVIYLSDDTIRNNIAFGIREDEIDEQAVTEALKKAQLYEFVESLPDGVETMVGDRGVRLSGGQRQRIGIARALYHDPDILILDEATSALDNETEAAVMEAVENLQGLKTMIIIAHRLTTVQNADVIFEVCEGQVVERSKEYVFGNDILKKEKKREEYNDMD